MTYILALDQGTSSSRSIIFNRQGRIISVAQQEFEQIYPKPGWVEHNPMEIWHSQLRTANLAIEKAGVSVKDIAAIGITNQRETTILWNRETGEPVHNAIVWQDRRTNDICKKLRAQGLEPYINQTTGLRLDPYFSATKIKWILETNHAARRLANEGKLAFGTVDSWLIWQLSNGDSHVTDVSNASRTMLFNLKESSWDTRLLESLGIPANIMPKVLPSAADFAMTHKNLFGKQLPVCGVAGDQQSALFGQACFKPGMAKNTYGTGCFMLMNTGSSSEPSEHGLLNTHCAQATNTTSYAIEGSVFVGGAVVQWLRDGLNAINHSSEVEALARSVSDSGGVCLVPAFTGLGAPWWKPDARGTITGITRGTTIAHIARAALESIAFQSASVLQAMSQEAIKSNGSPLMELRVDGGAAANNFLMQFQADILGIPVIRPSNIETTALGAAWLAGIGAGIYKDLDELEQYWVQDRIFSPSMPYDQAQEMFEKWEHAVNQTTLDKA